MPITFRIYYILSFILLISISVKAQIPTLENYNQIWTTPSKNASESMPLGGGDVGCNVWVENGSLYVYVSKSGTFDEHNTLLKLGRIKVELTPNPFQGHQGFRQELHLEDGYITVSQNRTQVKLWVDVFDPVIHIDVKSKTALEMKASYESWRYKNRKVEGRANNANSYKWAPQGEIITYKDSIQFVDDKIQFYHKNREHTVFDVAVAQQQMESVKAEMMNPLKQLTFGGTMQGKNLVSGGTYQGVYQDTDFKGYSLKSKKPSKSHQLSVFLHSNQNENIAVWKNGLNELMTSYKPKEKRTTTWWRNFWQRSFIYTHAENDSVNQIGQNYQLFRYMLGANAYGKYPTKFNGGLFTVDPVYTKADHQFTPDFRNWGGGTMTQQNQRLVYFPMFKSGDFDMLPSQLDYYLTLQKNAELRSQVYWNHKGAAFTEQLENFGLPNPAEYDWKRPDDYDPGMQYNAWLEYQWDTVFEFCKMMLEQQEYANIDVKKYKDFILSCLRFFDEHYQFLAKKRGRKALDANGHLVLYPGSAVETYKMAYNANSTISALKVISQKLLQVASKDLTPEDKVYLKDFQTRIPPLSFRTINNQQVLAPAKSWERINNTEAAQLYPVYPWKLYGLGKPDLKVAQNTYFLDEDLLKFRSHIGWKQDNIMAARLGLTDEAAQYSLLKMANSERRFPAFWGPGFDWVPDHNWGGAGMIGMQEMLMQEVDGKILLFPAWPKHWDVHFKLHAKNNTTVEVKLQNGQLDSIQVTPKEREKDILNLLNYSLHEKLNLN